MGRGVSSGGGQSSLGYLFGSGEPPKPTSNNPTASPSEGAAANTGVSNKPTAGAQPADVSKQAQPADVSKQTPAGIHSTSENNYQRADGQNCGNFITDRPSTKVHAAPGGGSSLDYLFGGGGSGSK